MVVVTEADAAAIRAIFQQRGELSAVVELRRLGHHGQRAGAVSTNRLPWRSDPASSRNIAVSTMF
ncbi:MAG TPA: hypothetical protein VE267_20670 [Bradyrhizobium sp.]|nr:hypothetical protein [Bradyrhizobium sp.]